MWESLRYAGVGVTEHCRRLDWLRALHHRRGGQLRRQGLGLGEGSWRMSISKTLRIQVKHRRFGFKAGLSAAAVNEWPSSPAVVKLASFAVALDAEREPGEIRRRIRAEILKRILV